MSLLAGSVSNVPPPTTSPRPVGAVPVLESRKRCHTDEPINQVARQLDFEMVIEEGPLLHEGAVGGDSKNKGLQLTKERYVETIRVLMTER